jgi:hypothetical protein
VLLAVAEVLSHEAGLFRGCVEVYLPTKASSYLESLMRSRLRG